MLEPTHLNMLQQGSAISLEVIRARGYRTITRASELRSLGFTPAQCRAPGLLIPLWTTDGQAGMCVYRPDNPRVQEDRRKRSRDGTFPNTVIKYETPKGAGIRLDCPPPCQPNLKDPRIPLWITEGQKKADSLASAGLCAIALLGVWNFKGKNELGAPTFLADWDYVALSGREVRIVFDSDVMVKHAVRQALDRLTAHLQRKGACVDAVYLPAEPGKGKVGVDDWLAAGHTAAELETLVEAPRPAPRAAESTMVILESDPLTILRPLNLVDGVPYAATWLYVQRKWTEKKDRNGELVRLDPPRVVERRELFIVRGDGIAYCMEDEQAVKALGVRANLPEVPPVERLWSVDGFKRYLEGIRPDPADVFRRVTGVIDRFIDFERSLASQEVMAEMIACWTLATWFLDAFNVVGFLWPNGDKGSGKTNLLVVISEMAYLGHLVLSGGSYAATRDMADYGATLAFDDAENLSNGRDTEPLKRELLLAGNHRGVTVVVKVQDANNQWHNRYINAFCPRLFSATRLPDSVLGSRTIIVPLVRTNDRQKANVDPLDHDAWPCPYRPLLDDLWALGLAHLPELKAFDKVVGKNASLYGRNLQPWRGILAVAAWLEHHGVAGLWERMDKLSVDYQNERTGLEYSDLTVLTIRALISVVEGQLRRLGIRKTYEVATAEVTGAAKQIAGEEETSVDQDLITVVRLGLVIRKMRLQKATRASNKKHGWLVDLKTLAHLAQSYALPLPEWLQEYGKHENIQPGGPVKPGTPGTPLTPGTPGEADPGDDGEDDPGEEGGPWERI